MTSKITEIVELSSSSSEESSEEYEDAVSIILSTSSSSETKLTSLRSSTLSSSDSDYVEEVVTSEESSLPYSYSTKTVLTSELDDEFLEKVSEITINDDSFDDKDLFDPVSFVNSTKKDSNNKLNGKPTKQQSVGIAKYMLSFEKKVGISDYTQNPFKNKKFESIEGEVTGDYDEAQLKMRSLSVIDPELELLDPNPDIHQLFTQLDHQFFEGFLSPKSIKLAWANNMYSTAGMFYPRRNGHPTIRLAANLFKMLPRKEMVETLLHEMIHAFVSFKGQRGGRSHGKFFKLHMKRINQEAGTNITVYHSFHREVRLLKKYIWRCSGELCRNTRPYGGYISLPTKRKPSRFDYCFRLHLSMNCGGQFEQVSNNFDGKQEQEVVLIDDDYDDELEENETETTE